LSAVALKLGHASALARSGVRANISTQASPWLARSRRQIPTPLKDDRP
jgi:hypothetical protein